MCYSIYAVARKNKTNARLIFVKFGTGTWDMYPRCNPLCQSGDLTAVVSPGCQDDAVPGSIY